jgi:DNA-binding NarL/FixJ family response regulator
MERTSRTTVAIVDHHALFTQCLALVLELRHFSCGVVPPGDAAQTDRILAELLAVRPEVLLVNADLGQNCDGVGLVAPMVRAGVAVVVITETVDEPLWGRCLVQGAHVVLSKSARLASVISVVRRVSQDQLVLDRSERDRLIGVYHRQAVERRELQLRLRRLTMHEGEILRHLMAGLTVREIAAVRVVSEATVRSQVKAILAKLELSSQIAAVAAARHAGWSACPRPLAS